jgi:tetratricopeptide (TPR) repeat protein
MQPPFLRAADLNDYGNALMAQGKHKAARAAFVEAERLLQAEAHTPEGRQALASVLMNQANNLRELGRLDGLEDMLGQSLALMQETTGDDSPEVATVLQAKGNLFSAHEQYEKALSLHRQAFEIRRRHLGAGHHDVALSLANMANVLFRMQRFYRGMEYQEQALNIFQRVLPPNHPDRSLVQENLRRLRQAEESVRAESRFGLVLIVCNTLPQVEDPPDPTTKEGAERIANELVEALIEHWDDMIEYKTTVPLLLVSAPRFEGAVSQALAHPIGRRFPDKLLRRINIPCVEPAALPDPAAPDPAALLPLHAVRTQFLAWLAEHRLDVLMVKPLTNYGATLDRSVLQALAQESPRPPGKFWKAKPSAQDIRPLTGEIVSFDGRDGPITGVAKSGNVERLGIITTARWHAQSYRPQAADYRVTGTVYLNLLQTRFFLQHTSELGLTLLDKWSMGPLTEIASSPWQDQVIVFENALHDLIAVLKMRPLRCPAERGMRGLRQSEID